MKRNNFVSFLLFFCQIKQIVRFFSIYNVKLLQISYAD